jgi:anti-sigma factor RsiW
MSCEEVRPELVAYLDGELEEELRARVEAHLEGCEACRAERDAYARTLQQVEQSPPPGISPEFRRSFMERFDAEQKPGWFAGWLRPAALLGAAAAAAVMVVVLWPGEETKPSPDEAVIASHLELFSDFEAIRNLDVLEDLEFIEALDEEG